MGLLLRWGLRVPCPLQRAFLVQVAQLRRPGFPDHGRGLISGLDLPAVQQGETTSRLFPVPLTPAPKRWKSLGWAGPGSSSASSHCASPASRRGPRAGRWLAKGWKGRMDGAEGWSGDEGDVGGCHFFSFFFF